MQKKILTTIILVALIGIIGLTYFFLKKEKQTFDNAAYEAIPSNSALILDIKNYGEFASYISSSNPAWEAISSFESIQEFNSLTAKIDSVVQKDESYKKLADNNFVLTVQQIGKNKLEYLFLVPLGNDEEIAIASKLIRDCYSDDSISSYSYNEKSIYNFYNPDDNTQGISYAIAQQTLIVSPSRIIVENAIKSIHSPNNLLSEKSFVKVKESAGKNVDANLYINFREIPNIAYLFADKSLQSMLSGNANLGSWGEFDINVKESSVLLNGFTSITDKTEYFSIFENQQAVNFEIKEVLPAGTSSFVCYGFSDKEKFLTQYELYLKKTNKYNNYEDKLNAINEKLSAPNIDPINIKKTFYSLLENEIAMVYANVNGLDIYQNTYAIMKVRSKTQAKEQIVGMIDSYCEKNNKNISDYTTDYKIDEKISYKIYEFPVKKVPALLWGKAFANTQANFVAFIENYVVFGNSNASVSKLIHAYELQKTLENDLEFKTFNENLLESYNWFVYSNITKSYDIYPNYVNDEIKHTIFDNAESLQKFEGFSIQMSADKDKLYNHIFIHYNPIENNKPHTVWESYLDTVIITKPKLLTNFHTGETNIFVQDAYFNLYIINKTGKIQHKIELKQKEQILSDVYEIDFYRNGKKQYLFNTENYIYLYDRLGNLVENFPVKIESGATTGLAVFDYDNSRDYRIFIPCKNHKVVLYDKEGKIVKGWEFGKTESDVSHPVQYFTIGTKDYLVFADKLNVYILNRRGESRVKVKEQIECSPKNTFTFESASGNTPARIITTDVKGNIKIVDFEGNVTTKVIKEQSKDHFFEYRDINADGASDYIFLDKDKLSAFSVNKDEIFTYSFDDDILLPPSIYKFSSKTYKIGVVDVQNSKVYLINGNGTLHEGFPLKGKTLFSIGYLYKNSGTFNLVIGGDENFLYNYEVK